MIEFDVSDEDYLNKMTYIQMLGTTSKCLSDQMKMFLGVLGPLPTSGGCSQLNHAAHCFKEALGAAMQCNQQADTSVGVAFSSLKDWDRKYQIKYSDNDLIRLKQINILNKLIKVVDGLLNEVLKELDDTISNTQLTLNDWSLHVRFKQVFDYFNELEVG